MPAAAGIPDEADALYAEGPDTFVSARDALAKRLRAEKRADDAAAVKALRKPSVTAWAINHAARTRPKELRELLAAADALRAAHEGLVAGTADRADLRAATEAERAAVKAFLATVAEAAKAAGHPVAAAGADRVRQTLHAAALDPDVRGRVEAGRLERDAEAVGAGGLLGGPVAAPARRPKAKRPAAKDKPPERDRRAKRAEREAALQAVRDAERAASAAQRDAERQARRAEIAEKAVEDARDRLVDAESELTVAAEELDAARRLVREAKAAAAEAQARLDRLD